MKGNKIIRIFLSVLLICGIMLTVGCAGKTTLPMATFPQESKETKPKDSVPPPTDDCDTDPSLNSLRQAMVDTSQVFAVAYFGYPEIIDPDTQADPFDIMHENAYWLCEDLPFLMEIPQDRIVGETGDLFCIVPRDENATVAVSRGSWDEENWQYTYDDILYSSDSGEPILLFCNSSDWEPDIQLYISGPSGEIYWYPQLDDNLCVMSLRNEDEDDLFFDFSPYQELLMADYRYMKDSGWVMPTAGMLAGTTWRWQGYLKDGRDVSYQVEFEEATLSVRWNDGIDEEDHVYTNAAWDLTYDEGFAILAIDFREFAGVLKYDLMYHEDFEQLYVGIDVVQEEMPIGWEPTHRFLTRSEAPDPTEMVGTWELAWTEVEGDRNEAEPDVQSIEITMDGDGLFWINYIDNNFPERSFYDKELVVFPDEIYHGCGNDQWSATVNYTGEDNTEYTLTVLEDRTLMLQQYWEMDGAPWVAYGWYERIG